MKKCWVDIFNGPHVHFFQNIDHFEKDIIFTARNYAPIPELIDLYNIPAQKIGFHGGGDSFNKLKSSIERTMVLAEYIKEKNIDLLINKHSVEASRVAWGLAIPSISYIDNELMVPQNMLVCPLTDVLIAPIAIDQHTLHNFTPSYVNILQYDGVSEIANVYNFKPNENILKQLNLTTDHPIIVLRGEPILASYSIGGKSIINVLIEKIKRDLPDAQIVKFGRAGEKEINITPNIDARSLFLFADVVITGGGTMAREAALLGSNALSFFEKPLAVDRYLIEKKLLQCYPGKDILGVNFKNQALRKKHSIDLNYFEHPFEMLQKAENLIRMKKPLPYDSKFQNSMSDDIRKTYFRKNAKLNGFYLYPDSQSVNPDSQPINKVF